jgi:hypothetical protein
MNTKEHLRSHDLFQMLLKHAEVTEGTVGGLLIFGERPQFVRFFFVNPRKEPGVSCDSVANASGVPE